MLSVVRSRSCGQKPHLIWTLLAPYAYINTPPPKFADDSTLTLASFFLRAPDRFPPQPRANRTVPHGRRRRPRVAARRGPDRALPARARLSPPPGSRASRSASPPPGLPPPCAPPRRRRPPLTPAPPPRARGRRRPHGPVLLRPQAPCSAPERRPLSLAVSLRTPAAVSLSSPAPATAPAVLDPRARSRFP